MWSTARIAGLFIIFGLSFISAMIPCITVRCLVNKFGVSSRFKRAISLLNCLAGGIFFATSVLDLLPEARESMEEVFTERDIDIDFPVTECIMGVGFLFILFLEHFAHRFCARVRVSESALDSKRVVQKKQHSEPNGVVGYYRKSDSTTPENSSSDDVIIVGDLDDLTNQDDVSYITYGTVENNTENGNYKPPKWRHEIDPKEQPKQTHSNQNSPSSDSNLMEDTKILATKKEPVETGDALQYAELESKEPKQIKTLRSIILLAALSLHMIFDGLALGLLEKQSDIWQLTLALAIHKVLVFFTIGLQLLELLKSVRKTIAAGLLFSVVSPLGILVGELITSGGNDVTRNTVSAVLQSFATGTFIFVTFFEILQGELNTGDHDLLKVFSTVVGFALIAVVRLLIHEE